MLFSSGITTLNPEIELNKNGNPIIDTTIAVFSIYLDSRC
jgi:hypothetical protein